MQTTRGKVHPIHALIQKTREIFLNLNFDEIENPLFIQEEDVYKQYGKEAPVILDRVFYLGGLPRPDIGLSDEEILKIKEISPYISIDKFKKILRNYREGAIEGDNMLEEMLKNLKINSTQAMEILDLFPTFKNIEPVCGRTTLRSHMTAAWFLTLETEVEKQSELPLKFFSIGLRFRREQKLDATHLRAHYGASCIMVAQNLNIEDGMNVAEKILNNMGFTDIKFAKKKATSNYYEQDKEYEIFSGGIEIADCGMYSRMALKNYNIPNDLDVFNIGFGLERILMVWNNISDVRKVLYPQFYEDVHLSDEEIAKSINLISVPETDEGRTLACKICDAAKIHANEKSPCKFLCFEGNLMNRKIKIFVFEDEENKNLLGPAALNEIYVFDESIYGIPKDTEKFGEEGKKIKEKGIKTNLNF
ncbi:MAG: O-phosphoserine--tRNA ligase, partial [Candidatus Altarchaeum sp.]|nr:O-phosphoserine--tRNA ligase [Candidatus Altarchaeum sp.]